MAPTYRRMATTTALAVRLAEASGAHDARVMSSGATLRQHCRTKAANDTKPKAAMDLDSQSATVSVINHNWKDAYARWLARIRDVILNEGNVPNEKQEQVLSVVHERCVTEETVADGTISDPLLRLVHGLLGSGKPRLLVWLRSYFTEVWQWTENREFVFLAPLNSMACNIGGSTVHGWGRVAFKDKRGMRILPQDAKDSDELPGMAVKEIVFDLLVMLLVVLVPLLLLLLLLLVPLHET